MGIFSKRTKPISSTTRATKPLLPLSAEQIERNELGPLLQEHFYPHTNEDKYFYDLAFPGTVRKSEGYDADYRNWKPLVDDLPTALEIRQMLWAVKDRQLSLNDVTRMVFKFDSYGKFIDYIQNELGHDRVASSPLTLKYLADETPSDDWFDEIQSRYVNRTIQSWLEDLGDRKSTHSSVGDLFRVQVQHVNPYFEAALIGFRTINYVLDKNGLKFNVDTNPLNDEHRLAIYSAGQRLVGDCCFVRGTALYPLDVVNNEVKEFVHHLLDGLDADIKSMLGDQPTKAKVFFTTTPMPYRVTLLEAAHAGAMMASIGADPSSCKFYKGYGLDKQPQDPTEREWFQK